MKNLIFALLLMGIGLATVFSVLILIIYFGKILISLINKYAPEEEIEKTSATANTASTAIDPNVAIAINMAISKLTDGKSKAIKIERI